MNADRLLEHFDRISDAPDAVPRLRRFILDLAVRGKLVEQDPNDEPADVLIVRLARTLPKKQTENPFLISIEPAITDETEYKLPMGWAWLPLGQLGIWATGCGFPKQYQGESKGEFLFCKVSDMNLPGNEIEIRSTVNSIDSDVMKKIRARANPVGTVVFPKIGGAIATHKRRLIISPTIIDNNCAGIKPIGLTVNRWLLLLMQRIDLTRYQSGTAVPAVSQSSLDPIRVGLPPLAEQHRIVAKVDELMQLCDQLESAQAKRERRRDRLTAAALAGLNGATPTASTSSPSPDASPSPRTAATFVLDHLPRLTTRPQHIQQLRQTILNLAVRGQLVTQDRNDEPASELLKRIQSERTKLIKAGDAKILKHQQLETEAVGPSGIPESWRWVSLSEIAFGFRYGTSVKCSYERTDNPVLRIPNVTHGRIDIDDLKYGRFSKQEAEDLRLQLGDILLVRSNGSLNLVGRAALVEDHAVGFCYAGYLVRMRTSRAYLDPRYVLLSLNSTHVRNQIEVPIRTTVGLKNVNTAELSRLTISLPPLSEQHRIVAKVDELMVLCDRLEEQLITTHADSHRLLESILHEALAPSIKRVSPRTSSKLYAEGITSPSPG